MEQNEGLLEQDDAVQEPETTDQSDSQVSEQQETTEHSTIEVNDLTSMEVLLAQEEISLDLPKRGESRSGVIVRINDDEILVSIGAKSEGIIPGKELSQLSPEERAELELGKEVFVFVVTPEDQHGNLLLSYTRALEETDWDRAEELFKSGDIYEGTVSGYNKGGLIVKMGRLRGFVPSSQVSPSRRMAYGGSSPDQRWAKVVGQKIIVRVIEVDRNRRRLIFSEMAALQESREIFKERLLSEIEVGDELDGRVTSLADFGAFVNINGADGLVHLTEISWDRIRHPSQILKVGEEVRVRVINIDRENKRIGLSIRQLLKDPWPEKIAAFREGQLVEATVVRLARFGAFARLENTDLEGLIHISELSEQRIEHPKEVVKEGDVVTLRIIRIDVEQRRIGLSLRKVQSLAYADLDLKFALEEEKKASEEEAETEEAVQEAADSPVDEVDLPTAEDVEPAADEEMPEEAEAAEEAVQEAADSPVDEVDLPATEDVEAAAEEEMPEEAETAEETVESALDSPVDQADLQTAEQEEAAAAEEVPEEAEADTAEESVELEAPVDETEVEVEAEAAVEADEVETE